MNPAAANSSPAAAPQGSTPPHLRTIAILPARLASTRLPRKMLLAETGSPLVVHSARNVQGCAAIERVVVATDSPEIVEAAHSAEVEVLLTSAEHPSGTDRVQEALQLIGADFEVVINVQGDEPDVAAIDLERLAAAFVDAEVDMATLCVPITSESEWRDPSVVKVVCGSSGDALYFSRAPIPADDHARAGAQQRRLRHVGVYAFRPAALRRFCALPAGDLETQENLEQLRWLEAGGRLRVLEATHTPRGIDTRDDYEEFVARTAS